MVGVSNPNQILAATTYVTASNKEKNYSEVLANDPRTSLSGPVCIVDIVPHI
jgi:hypothetical protein